MIVQPKSDETHILITEPAHSDDPAGFESFLHGNTHLDSDGPSCSVHAPNFHISASFSKNSKVEVYSNPANFSIKLLSFTDFFCQKLGLKISPLRLRVSWRSVLIKSWFYNRILFLTICQNDHSGHLQTASVQWIQLYFHVPWSPTEEVRGSRMSGRFSLAVQCCSVGRTVYWDKDGVLVICPSPAVTLAQLNKHITVLSGTGCYWITGLVMVWLGLRCGLTCPVRGGQWSCRNL